VIPGWMRSKNACDLALFGNSIAGSFVTAAGGEGGTVVRNTAQGELPPDASAYVTMLMGGPHVRRRPAG
jgi:hypothetical protein